MDAVKAVGDAKATVEALAEKLRAKGYVSGYNGEIEAAKAAWDKEWDRLAGIEYTGDDFEPIIKARDPRTVPEFVKLTNGKITQTAALAAINKTMLKMQPLSQQEVLFQVVCSVCGEQTREADIMQNMVIPAWDTKWQQLLV